MKDSFRSVVRGCGDLFKKKLYLQNFNRTYLLIYLYQNCEVKQNYEGTKKRNYKIEKLQNPVVNEYTAIIGGPGHTHEYTILDHL